MHITTLTSKYSDQLFMYIMYLLYHTLFCRFKSTPAFTSSLITPVLPSLAATISTEYPSCMYIMYCVLNKTWCKGVYLAPEVARGFTCYTGTHFGQLPTCLQGEGCGEKLRNSAEHYKMHFFEYCSFGLAEDQGSVAKRKP